MILRNLLLLLIAFMVLTPVSAQDDDPILPYQVAPQNLLKFNRFLINPTFSTVREDNSYVNLLHRNQSVSFKDNDQTYFLSYSGRVGDKSGLGLSLYNQSVGPVSNIGALANFAYGVKLSEKSNLTFGANIAYYNTGLNRNELDLVDQNDFRINGTQDSNILSFQPGFNLSYGQIDFGIFAENLFDYNLKTSETLTDFKNKTYSAHLQYTYPFKNGSGILESARVMPLARFRMNPQGSSFSEEEQDLSLGGSIILDLPKLGWIQGGFDSFYGASAGAGFNINQRLSLGYTMEKGIGTEFNNLGVTHEISLAYSFSPNLTEDRVMLEEDNEELVDNEELNTDDLASNDELEELKKKLEENEEILAKLMSRQDSLETNRQTDLERRFDMVMKMVRAETKGERPDLEQRAKLLFLTGQDQASDFSEPNNSNSQNPNKNNVENSSALVAQNNTSNKNSSDETRPDLKIRRFKNLHDENNGYYLIGNVYNGPKYMKKYMNTLKQKGFSPNSIYNPENKLSYVYLERYDTWQEVVDAYNSNMGGRYDEALWVMDIDNQESTETSKNNTNNLQEKTDKYDSGEMDHTITVKDQIVSNNTAAKKFTIEGIGSDYYIIANVFANPKNAKRFVRLLNSYGLSASYFINPENNWRYVYLKRHESWNNALISYYSNLNDAYDDKMWIMRVKSNAVT